MEEYEKQARDFLVKTDTSLLVRFIGTQPHFSGDDEPRDVYKVHLQRGNREYTFNFGNSIAETERRFEELLGDSREYTGAHYRLGKANPRQYESLKLAQWEKLAREWHEPKKWEPSAYSILAGIGNEPPEDIDELASEFGVKKPSEAVRIHAALLEEWEAVQRLWNDDEIEQLREII